MRSKFFPLFRRRTSASSAKSSASSQGSITADDGRRNRSKNSLLILKNRTPSIAAETVPEDDVAEPMPPPPSPPQINTSIASAETQIAPSADPPQPPLNSRLSALRSNAAEIHVGNPTLTLETPTPEPAPRSAPASVEAAIALDRGQLNPSSKTEGTGGPEQNKLELGSTQKRHIHALLEAEQGPAQGGTTPGYFVQQPMAPKVGTRRKIWVKRPGASATMVSVEEDFLVDDLRDLVLRKYANSLGRSFDSPDVTLRITPRSNSNRHSLGLERTLEPDESIIKALSYYYPDGQTVNEALLIDVPQRRTPKHSPRVHFPYYTSDQYPPPENATEYFPTMPIGGAIPSPHLPSNLSVISKQSGGHHGPTNAMSIINTGQAPNLPSPGGSSRTGRHATQPRFRRQNTTSPTVLGAAGLGDSIDRIQSHHGSIPPAPPLPTPPLPSDIDRRTATPPPRVSSPRPAKAKKPKKQAAAQQFSVPGLLDGAVPPINVLIVEDNIINLRLLEAFMKRLKVRWSTAMNGREAVNKWREGGFHLVLMDIQLPVMNGLDATKEIRRLETVNHIGVFSGRNSLVGKGESPQKREKPADADVLINEEGFKSQVIIVALTASSLQSDRHEALAAGCNDFLTKPVGFAWLERKVMEWGCMQALIDFDGWHKWKDFSAPAVKSAAAKASKSNPNSALSPTNPNNNPNTPHRPSVASLPSTSPTNSSYAPPHKSSLSASTAPSPPNNSLGHGHASKPGSLNTSPNSGGQHSSVNAKESERSPRSAGSSAGSDREGLGRERGGKMSGSVGGGGAASARGARKEKRQSLGAGSLSEVLEERGEGEGDGDGAER